MARNKDITVNGRMRDDGWDDEIIVLSSLRKIILSSEYYEPAYDTSIGNLRIRDETSRKRKMRRNWMFDKERDESNNSTVLHPYYYLIDKPYVMKDLGDI